MRYDDPATLDVALEHGLSRDEWERLIELIGRTPNLTELGVVAAMWSEHCSYKTSRLHLAKLPTTGPTVIQGPGENAGVVDLGDGWAAIFKVESHNHPSFIEPYQGAATGVGGILRDVFTMGARPVMLLDSLRFGEPDAPRMRHLIDGVVRGISDYGNCMGIPTLGGEVDLHGAYNGNILVNAMCVGVVRTEAIFKAVAGEPGNPVIYFGSRTGCDGIHGATMASDVFDDEAEAKRPTVQVGDPFTEKLLLECSLELMASGAVVGIQDMGAAGLTSSSFEMAGRSGLGMYLDLDLVPKRQTGMTPYDLMLSESQERMVLVARKGSEEQALRICSRWELEAVVIGRVTDDGHVTADFGGRQVLHLPVEPLAQGAPKYDRPYELAPPRDAELPRVEELDRRDLAEDLRALLASPQMASARWIWSQYDQSVGADTVVAAGADAAITRIKGTDKGLAATIDCNALHCSIDPRHGARLAVAEAARNLAAVGARPLGVTDCLNFASPESPDVMGQFVAAVEGMAEACRELAIPVVSGNVSFYNETSGRPILPTPAVGMVGVVEPLVRAPRCRWRSGEQILLIGADAQASLGGSRYLQVVLGLENGPLAPLDLELEARIQQALRTIVRQHDVAAHDLSDGGLAAALVEMAGPGLGCEIDLDGLEVSPAEALFSEGPSRALISLSAELREPVMAALDGVGCLELGVAGGPDVLVRRSGAEVLRLSVEAALSAREQTLPALQDEQPIAPCEEAS